MAKISKDIQLSKKSAAPVISTFFTELKDHYDMANDETDKRRTGRGRIGSISLDEADELFRSWLDEDNWPYDALLFDPRVFTFIFEKTSRLISSKLRGRLIPREGGDVLAAYVNNELLNFQWDQANQGGSMISKWAITDINTRKYGAAFSLCKWRYEVGKDGSVLFDGPDMQILNNRDCLPDPAATSIESCNWFQARQYVTFQELERVNDMARTKPVYHNLDKLREAIGKDSDRGGDTRDINWTSRNRAISGLTEDPIGRDRVFKTVEIVTEYRRDRWITFSPRHGVILRDIPNPYKNNELPVVMLRYYQIDDDLYGMSEIEPVKGLQKAINAILSQYVDEINQKLYSPIAIGPGVRQHTLHWGKGARWIMNNPMTDFRLVESRSNAAQYFNNTYSVLVSAMMNAIGEGSLGVSNIARFQPEKTATEVRQLITQRNARDNFNQIFLAEAIQRQMKLWYTMNQVMIFNDPSKKQYIIRIVGKEAIKYFQEKGLDALALTDEGARAMGEDINRAIESGDEWAREGLAEEKYMVPLFPVETKEKAGKKEYVSKFSLDTTGEVGNLIIEPEDLKGTYDFIADVESMSLVSGDQQKEARRAAIAALLTNPNVIQLLAAEGVKPKFKDLFIAWLEDSGFKDAEKFFEMAKPLQEGGGAEQGMPGGPVGPPQMGEGEAPPMPTGGGAPPTPEGIPLILRGVMGGEQIGGQPIPAR